MLAGSQRQAQRPTGVTSEGWSEGRAQRVKAAKKQSLLVVNEHFIRFALRFAAVLKHAQPKGCELIFNLTAQVIIQRFLKGWLVPSNINCGQAEGCIKSRRQGPGRFRPFAR